MGAFLNLFGLVVHSRELTVLVLVKAVVADTEHMVILREER